MGNPLGDLGLKYNPFEPSASGTPISGELWVPDRWRQPLVDFLDTMRYTGGPKAYAVLGEYGSGKSYLLHWLERQELPDRRIRPFYFEDPGLQFYDLANDLLRRIGREEFAKSLWEFLNPQLEGFQLSYLGSAFLQWLQSIKRYRQEDEAIRALASQALNTGITGDEEIAHKLGRLVVETYDRPYFEYKDFVAGRRTSLVAEGEEAPYFAAVLRALRFAGNVQAVGFLLDEFEEVSLQKRLTRRQAHGYLATMKRLIGLTEREEFWIIVAMTPQAADITARLEPALWERFISQGQHQFQIPQMTDDEAMAVVAQRLQNARADGSVGAMFPFADDLHLALREDIKSSPRRLVKVCSLAIAEAARSSGATSVPFGRGFLQDIQARLYPISPVSEGGRP